MIAATAGRSHAARRAPNKYLHCGYDQSERRGRRRAIRPFDSVGAEKASAGVTISHVAVRAALVLLGPPGLYLLLRRNFFPAPAGTACSLLLRDPRSSLPCALARRSIRVIVVSGDATPDLTPAVRPPAGASDARIASAQHAPVRR